MKTKRGEVNLPVVILSIFGGITIILAGSFVYFSLNGPDHSESYIEKILNGEIINPITQFKLDLFDESEELELDESDKVIKIDTEEGVKTIIIKSEGNENLSIEDVEEELVRYASIVLKLYNLHNIPFTGIPAKIQVDIENTSYSIKISKGSIIIEDGEVSNPDIIIHTTYEELFKIIEDENYVSESIDSGKTQIEIVAGKLVLFSKGYLSLFDEFKEYL